jgi:hypothetical protein
MLLPKQWVSKATPNSGVIAASPNKEQVTHLLQEWATIAAINKEIANAESYSEEAAETSSMNVYGFPFRCR